MSECGECVFRALDEPQLVRLAQALARVVAGGGVVYLHGPLGAGKTTFARALLRGLGVESRIKSPTYSLLETYVLDGLNVQHLDLYRIAAADEVEWLGLADLDNGTSLWLIEWPERAPSALLPADLVVDLEHAPVGRNLCLRARSEVGRRWLDAAALDGVHTAG